MTIKNWKNDENPLELCINLSNSRLASLSMGCCFLMWVRRLGFLSLKSILVWGKMLKAENKVRSSRPLKLHSPTLLESPKWAQTFWLA